MSRFHRRLHGPAGLIGQVFAILLLAMVLEFGMSTLLYERASQFSVRDDEARRLAEHLVIVRKVLADQPAAARGAMARELTTSRYAVRWEPGLAAPPPRSSVLDGTYRQVIGWEPDLANADLRLALAAPGRGAVTAGGLKLPDGSWATFRTRQAIHQSDLAAGRVLLAMIPAATLILLGGLAVRRTLLPLRGLAVAADEVGNGDGAGQYRTGQGGAGDGATVPELGPSEVRRVIVAFNRMRARIHRLIDDRTQALFAVGHDLRTPLARLRLRADGITDASLRDAVAADVAEMDAMVASLLAYLGGEDEVEPLAATDLAVLCATICDDAVDRGRDAEYRGPAHLEVPVRRVMLKRALVNLVENALHHAHRVSVTLDSDAVNIRVRIEDDGPGIPEEALARVLEPFVRLDTARARDTIGLGLGLPIVARAVAEHGGALTLSNRAQGGLRAEIVLPVA